MRGFLLGAVLALITPIVAVIGVLLVMPDMRHAAFRAAVEVPGFGVSFMLRRALLGHNFSNVNLWLNRQMDMVEEFAPGQNALLPGLIANVEFSIEKARSYREFAAIRPFLRRLVDFDPVLFPARIWLARSLMHDQPKAAMEHLEAAAKLASADERTYRLAIGLAVRENWNNELTKWCQRYNREQFGGPRPHTYETIFGGIGLQRMALEIIDASNKLHLIRKSDLQLNDRYTYDFIFHEPLAVKELRLHVNTVPGISIKIDDLHLYRDGLLVARIPGNDLTLTSWGGFHLTDGRVLATARDGEIVEIQPSNLRYGSLDRIDLTLAFERLGLISNRECVGMPLP